MNRDPVARETLRTAERGTRPDASRLVDSVPELMREARRRQADAAETSPTVASLAPWALPRFAVATALAVVVATAVALWDRSSASVTATSLESMILGGEEGGTGDAVFDALLDLQRNDG